MMGSESKMVQALQSERLTRARTERVFAAVMAGKATMIQVGAWKLAIVKSDADGILIGVSEGNEFMASVLTMSEFEAFRDGLVVCPSRVY